MPFTPPDPGRLRFVFDLLAYALKQLEQLAEEHEAEDLLTFARTTREGLDKLAEAQTKS